MRLVGLALIGTMAVFAGCGASGSNGAGDASGAAGSGGSAAGSGGLDGPTYLLWNPVKVVDKAGGPDVYTTIQAAVNQVFVGASNDLGEFRAGSVAALLGVVPAVVLGGIGTVAVAALWMVLFPGLRKARHLSGRV